MAHLNTVLSGLYENISGVVSSFIKYDDQLSGIRDMVEDMNTDIGGEWIPQTRTDVPLIQRANVYLEEKIGNGSAFEVDFSGKQIQKYSAGSAAGSAISLTYTGLSGMPDDFVPTVEIQIPVSANVTTISLPADVQIIDMPDSLEGGNLNYHDIVFRAQKNSAGAWKVYANYSYMFTE